jgi:hypothetical protein
VQVAGVQEGDVGRELECQFYPAVATRQNMGFQPQIIKEIPRAILSAGPEVQVHCLAGNSAFVLDHNVRDHRGVREYLNASQSTRGQAVGP